MNALDLIALTPIPGGDLYLAWKHAASATNGEANVERAIHANV